MSVRGRSARTLLNGGAVVEHDLEQCCWARLARRADDRRSAGDSGSNSGSTGSSASSRILPASTVWRGSGSAFSIRKSERTICAAKSRRATRSTGRRTAAARPGEPRRDRLGRRNGRAAPRHRSARPRRRCRHRRPQQRLRHLRGAGAASGLRPRRCLFAGKVLECASFCAEPYAGKERRWARSRWRTSR